MVFKLFILDVVIRLGERGVWNCDVKLFDVILFEVNVLEGGKLFGRREEDVCRDLFVRVLDGIEGYDLLFICIVCEFWER